MADENNVNNDFTDDVNDATITPNGNTGAEIRTSEDAPGESRDLEAIIRQQNETVASLIEQNKLLSEQVSTLIRSTPVTNTPADEDTPGIPEDYVPLADLGKMIGKTYKKE